MQDLLCREVPDGDPAVIFDRALDALQAEVAKKKQAATTRPRAAVATKQGSRYIPAEVRRAVWKRDAAQCAFEGSGGRCAERRYLELHHVVPHGHEGLATVTNISLRCRAHNIYESELAFGRFDASIVREARENYAVSGRITPVPERVRSRFTDPRGQPDLAVAPLNRTSAR